MMFFNIKLKIIELFLRLKHLKGKNIMCAIVTGSMKEGLGGIYSDKDIENFSSENMEYLRDSLRFKYVVNQLRMPEEKIIWNNYNTLASIIENNRGTLFCSFHLSNYYLFPLKVAQLGHPVTVLLSTPGKFSNVSAMNNLDIEFVKPGPTAIRKLLNALYSNRVVYMLLDEAGLALNKERMVNVNLFGKKLHVAKGIAWLHRKTKLPVFPIVTLKNKYGNYVINIEKPFEYDDYLSMENHYSDHFIQNIFKIYEKYLIKYPAQWLQWIRWEYLIQNRDIASTDIKVIQPSIFYKINSQDYKLFRKSKENIWLYSTFSKSNSLIL